MRTLQNVQRVDVRRVTVQCITDSIKNSLAARKGFSRWLAICTDHTGYVVYRLEFRKNK